MLILISILLIILPSMLLDSLTAAKARKQPKQPLRTVWALSSEDVRPARRKPYPSRMHSLVMPLCSA